MAKKTKYLQQSIVSVKKDAKRWSPPANSLQLLSDEAWKPRSLCFPTRHPSFKTSASTSTPPLSTPSPSPICLACAAEPGGGSLLLSRIYRSSLSCGSAERIVASFLRASKYYHLMEPPTPLNIKKWLRSLNSTHLVEIVQFFGRIEQNQNIPNCKASDLRYFCYFGTP